MKMKNFKEMSNEELLNKVEELKKEKFEARAKLLAGDAKESGKIRNARRDLARVYTELKLRETAKADA